MGAIADRMGVGSDRKAVCNVYDKLKKLESRGVAEKSKPSGRYLWRRVPGDPECYRPNPATESERIRGAVTEEWRTKEEIVAAAGIHGTCAGQVLRRMVKEGEAECRVKRNSVHLRNEWRLRT